MIALGPEVISFLVAPGWLGVAMLLGLVAALAVLATALDRPRLVIPAVVVIGVGALVLTLGFDGRPAGLVAGILPLALGLVGIVAGGPVAVLVLAAATRGGPPTGEHGGIIVPVAGAVPAGRAKTPTREVLRGGTTIGYLERTVVIAAALIGRWELVAALIAVKGLGRFRDLDAGAATERFIIGTLVSTLWAGVCAALIVLA